MWAHGLRVGVGARSAGGRGWAHGLRVGAGGGGRTVCGWAWVGARSAGGRGWGWAHGLRVGVGARSAGTALPVESASTINMEPVGNTVTG